MCTNHKHFVTTILLPRNNYEPFLPFQTPSTTNRFYLDNTNPPKTESTFWIINQYGVTHWWESRGNAAIEIACFQFLTFNVGSKIFFTTFLQLFSSEQIAKQMACTKIYEQRESSLAAMKGKYRPHPFAL